MLTPIKKARMAAAPFLLGIIITVLLAGSCNQHKTGEVCIPVPTDTSALGKIDHFIPMMDLDLFKKDFKSQRDSVSRRNPDLSIPISEAFNKAALLDILKDPRSVGIRIYYGVKKGGKANEIRLILVGVDEQGKDLFIAKGSPMAAQAGTDLGGAEFGQCYPPCTVTGQ
jgi:hypothetical protein